jgi:hypothetical protein
MKLSYDDESFHKFRPKKKSKTNENKDFRKIDRKRKLKV